jgi:hypothetical protein
MALIDVLANLNRVTREIELKAERSIGQCAEDLLDKAVQRTPIDTGELRLSGTATVEKKGVESTGRVGFGGGQVDYALAVHETIKNYKEPGTGAKYLENPLKENAQRYFNKIADDIRL